MNDINRRNKDRNFFDLDLKHDYLYFRRTKIIATIGPSSSSPEIIRALITKGLNVARINFSHGRPEEHVRTMQTMHSVVTQSGCTASVVSSDRPSAPIIALTSSDQVLKRLQLLWGVYPHFVGKRPEVKNRITFAEALMKGMKLADNGDFMLMVRGIGQKKTETQSITIHQMS